ncbi:unnamed protein product [Ectocarpus sp. CCAP 1310/34]|nr:unnamed protein product [Ectocarpus sp. CCAP 1310/34]
MDGPLQMPHKWKDMVYYTTLGSGTSKAKTFMEKPSTVLTKFKSYKAEYTKVWLWLDT